jgi:hypothetical protein
MEQGTSINLVSLVANNRIVHLPMLGSKSDLVKNESPTGM